jgi:hypothetical protein
MTAIRPPLDDGDGEMTVTRRAREDGAERERGTRSAPTLSRRQFLPRAAAAAAGLVAAGAVGYELPHRSGSGRRSSAGLAQKSSSSPPTTAAAGSSRVQTFLTRPDLRPPAVRMTQFGPQPAPGTAPRFIVLAPMNAVPASEPQ